MKKIVFAAMVLFIGIASAQGTRTVPIQVSNQTQMIGSKEYFIHIVEQGQTLFSIARAYGLKYYDAVIKTDIHDMKVGDTVWLPKTDSSVAAVMAAAERAVSESTSTHYIKVEAGMTLYSLAREYGVTVEDIVEANPELRNEQLKAGQMLKIPPRKTDKGQSGKASPSGESAQPKPSQSSATPSAKQKETPTTPAPQKPTVSKPEAPQSVTPTHTETLPPTPFKAVNPYPFTEVPSDFPSKQAGFLAASQTSGFKYQVRDRQSIDKVYVTVVMPLNLDKIDEISTSKFDIEQRGKKEYKVFEFIQFYEGILMALDQLKERGYNVVLNVVDLTSTKDEDVVEAYNSHNVANSDFIIALLVKKPFEKIAELAKQSKVFVINPFSSRGDVVSDNPYVVKYMPSTESTVKGLLDVVENRHKNGHLYIVHSNNKKAGAVEKLFVEEMQRQLEKRATIKYTMFDWAMNAKLVKTLQTTHNNAVISLYDQDANHNTVFATTLINRLSSVGKNAPRLITVSNYLTEYPNIDFDQLEKLNYTTVTLGYLDYNNYVHKQFIDTYKENFRTEPNTLYAGVAHDIMLYFVTAISQRGAEFWRNPQKFKAPEGMLFPFSLKQSSATGGYENQSPVIYQMVNYKMQKM